MVLRVGTRVQVAVGLTGVGLGDGRKVGDGARVGSGVSVGISAVGSRSETSTVSVGPGVGVSGVDVGWPATAVGLDGLERNALI